MINSFPYIVISLILVFLYFGEIGRIKGVSSRMAINIAFLVLLIFIGLRGFVLTDYINYYPFYANLPKFNALGTFDLMRYEPGFVIYSSLIKTLGFNYFGWVFINSLIDLIALRFFFKRFSPSVILSLICFLAFSGILIEFNLYRNAKAIDLFLFSFPYLIERKCLPYFLLNILGITFHSSAIIYLPLYFLLTIKLNNKLIWTVIVIINIIYIGHISVISNIINNLSFMHYFNGYEKLTNHINNAEAYSFSIGFFERTFSIFIFTNYKNKLIRKNIYNNALYNCYFLYYIFFMLFNEVAVLVQRIPILFAFSYWVLYPSIIYLHKNWRNLINISISLLLALKIYASYSDAFYEYENVLWNKVDYNKAHQRTLNLI